MKKLDGKTRYACYATACIFALCVLLTCPAPAPAQNLKLTPAPAAPSPSQGTVDSTSNVPVKGQGVVTGFSLEKRMLEIDHVPYVLASDLVVQDKDGNILLDYKIEYLNMAYRVEFVRIKHSIKQITILQLTS